MFLRKFSLVSLHFLIVIWPIADGFAGDWPMWRHDPMRTGASPADLPADLHLRWVHQFPPPRPAWPHIEVFEKPRLNFDETYEPVVSGKTMYVPSSTTDSITALDTETGQLKWQFYTEGPVRFAPVAWRGRVYFASDDGYLYCVNGQSGKLIWKHRGGPSDRRLLGNGRLISMWPCRGGPVITDGTIYFAAGIWPFMGVFVKALDADTGQLIWMNDATGALFTDQPHGSRAFSGPAPQGHLVITGEKLLVPCGRTYPAVFDRKTGKLLSFELGFRDEVTCNVVASADYFFAGVGCLLNEDGTYRLVQPHGYRLPVISAGVIYRNTYDFWAQPDAARQAGPMEAQDLAHAGYETAERYGGNYQKLVPPVLWDVPDFEVKIKAGHRLYGVSGSEIVAVATSQDRSPPRIVWRSQVEGRPISMLAADEKLFVVTAEGQIYSYGARPEETLYHKATSQPLSSQPNDRTPQIERILDTARQERGYAWVAGVDDGQLVEALVNHTQLHVIAVDSDRRRVDALRRRWDGAGWYGRRVAALVADPRDILLPPCAFRLISSEENPGPVWESDGEWLRRVTDQLRPFGGVACFELSNDEHQRLTEALAASQRKGVELGRVGDMTVIRRVSPPAGSANWTHEHADAGNTRMSGDRHVKLPLGMLWFGGELRNDMLYVKHLMPPRPLVVNGRMFVQGPGTIRAVDVYTGLILWTYPFEDPKELRSLTYTKNDYRATYQLPEGPDRDYTKIKRVGHPCAAAEDGLYIVDGRQCLWVHPVTGRVVKTFSATAEDGKPLYWDTVRLSENVLVATATSTDLPMEPLFDRDTLQQLSKDPAMSEGLWRGTLGLEVIPANYLIAIDRHSGKMLWRRKARCAFLGNKYLWHMWGSKTYENSTVAVGDSKAFCLDMLPPDLVAAMRRRGHMITKAGAVYALDLQTGDVHWHRPVDHHCSLSYSSEHDILLQASDHHMSPGQGFIGTGTLARRGGDGEELWRAEKLHGPFVLHHRTIYAGLTALDLLTGEPTVQRHLLSDEPIPWTLQRGYGCNVPIAGENLLTFRSGAAAYYDLIADSGTGNFGGTRAGCSNSYIPACGVLNAANSAYGCACNYQNDTSFALVPMPDAELDTWVWNKLPPAAQPVKRVGINFGAPGNRRAENGTLWLACRSGLTEPVAVSVRGDKLEKFTWHSSRIEGKGLKWVAASGVDGVRQVSIRLRPVTGTPVQYTVRLHFVEPLSVAPEHRKFDIALQGTTKVRAFDIVKQVGSQPRAAEIQFRGVPVDDYLEITFTPTSDSKLPHAVISGVEVLKEP